MFTYLDKYYQCTYFMYTFFVIGLKVYEIRQLATLTCWTHYPYCPPPNCPPPIGDSVYVVYVYLF